MANTMAGYMDNLANAAGVHSGKLAAVNERLAKITATLKILVESNALCSTTVYKQSKDLFSLRQHLNKTKQRGGGRSGSPLDSRVTS